MKKVNYMNSSGIRALVAGQKKMKAHSGKFSLLNIHEGVLTCSNSRRWTFFTIVEGEDELLTPRQAVLFNIRMVGRHGRRPARHPRRDNQPTMSFAFSSWFSTSSFCNLA